MMGRTNGISDERREGISTLPLIMIVQQINYCLLYYYHFNEIQDIIHVTNIKRKTRNYSVIKLENSIKFPFVMNKPARKFG